MREKAELTYMTRNDTVLVEESSGNIFIFADYGFAHPEREQPKADLTLKIFRTIKQRAPVERAFEIKVWPNGAPRSEGLMALAFEVIAELAQNFRGKAPTPAQSTLPGMHSTKGPEGGFSRLSPRSAHKAG